MIALASRAIAALTLTVMDSPVLDSAMQLPTVDDIDAAARRLSGVALHTPLLTSAALDAMTGGRVFLKAETLQRTGSFKFRGAYNKLAPISRTTGEPGALWPSHPAITRRELPRQQDSSACPA